MKKTSKTVIFFGNERLATGVTTNTPILKALVQSGYTVAAIVSNYNRTNNRTVRHLEVENFASEHNIPILSPAKLNDVSDQLRKLDASVGVLVAYGKMVPQDIIDIFPNGIINVHPSLLPLHRGPTPIESVILDGSQSTAVSLMQLVKSMDAGPVYEQVEVPLGGDETKQELVDKLAQIGSHMIIDTLPKIQSGNLRATPQSENMATYDSLIKKSDGLIDWSKPAIEIEREIRAYAVWPGSKTIIAGKDVLITKAHVVVAKGEPGAMLVSKKDLVIVTGEDGLAIDTIKPLGKSDMDIRAFLAGYGTLLNAS